MDYETGKCEKSEDRSLAEALPIQLARKYSSLLARIETIYGRQITTRDFLDISEDDFAAQRLGFYPSCFTQISS